MILRELVFERANNACEAMVQLRPYIWTRCGVTADLQMHHILTRARGGAILDEEGEIYHLMVLCFYHHRMADGEEAYEGDLLIDGYMSRENGRAVYHGSDPYLKERYPE